MTKRLTCSLKLICNQDVPDLTSAEWIRECHPFGKGEFVEKKILTFQWQKVEQQCFQLPEFLLFLGFLYAGK